MNQVSQAFLGLHTLIINWLMIKISINDAVKLLNVLSFTFQRSWENAFPSASFSAASTIRSLQKTSAGQETFRNREIQVRIPFPILSKSRFLSLESGKLQIIRIMPSSFENGPSLDTRFHLGTERLLARFHFKSTHCMECCSLPKCNLVVLSLLFYICIIRLLFSCSIRVKSIAWERNH
jgi:hypothetical protein